MKVLTNSNKQAIDQAKNDDEAIIKHLASLDKLDYDRTRKNAAKELNIRPSTLDDLVSDYRAKANQQNSEFDEIDPWHEPINLADLLDEITATIQRFIILDTHQAQTASLWVCACWFADEINCAPILLINAPEKACGKTQLLTVLSKLAPRSIQAANISSSVLFRMIEKLKPTLFIDEIETMLNDNEELRGIINAGHTRDSAYVWRSVAKGDDFDPKSFNVWGMKAIAGINAVKLAETITSRSIIIQLRRKKPDENVQRLRHVEPNCFVNLKAKLARCAQDHFETIANCRPLLPDELGDRDQDNWEPLFQVANLADGHWPETAFLTSIRIQSDTQAPQSNSNELLADIKEIFELKSVIKISTSDLIQALCEDDEKSWATYNRGKQITPRQLSSKLKDYGISSKTLRINNYETAKGYELEMFNDAFQRYLKPIETTVTE